MKFVLCQFFLLLNFFVVEAQFNVVFRLGKYPPQYSLDNIFVAGNFNGWNPGNAEYVLSSVKQELSVQLPGGQYEFKCTRGGWEKVECMENGKDIGNRYFNLQADTIIEINISGWKDDFERMPKMHTASQQVHVLDTSFFIPQLNRTRRIWIYLPVDYAKTKKRYPVMYMHDGQNLFDEATSGFGEWGVDECLDSLIASGKPSCIVVGIDNGGAKRMSEYNPYAFSLENRAGASQKFFPEGNEYISFLVETLKPFIDSSYRTLSNSGNTIIAGSSMGGLISYYAMLQQPDVFGKGGIFSPAFWTAPAIKSLTDSLAWKNDGKFFFYMGGKEGGTMVRDMEEVQEILGEKSSAMIYSLTDPESSHNETAWRKWFVEFYSWIMADGFNTVIKIKD